MITCPCPNCGNTTEIAHFNDSTGDNLTFGKTTGTRLCLCACGAFFEETHTWQYIGGQTNLIKVRKGEDE